jgi:hypothetical protein
MYELTCPACQHTLKLPFVRIGAMAVCRSCAHRFAVQAENIRRLVTVPADTGLDADNPLLLGYPVEKPPSPAGPPSRPKMRKAASASSSSSSSAYTSDDLTAMPISEMMGQPRAELMLTPIQPVMKHEDPSDEVARVIARHRTERLMARRLLGAGIFVAIVLVVAITVVLWRARGPGRTDAPPQRRKQVNRPPGKTVPELTKVTATALPTSGWKRDHKTVTRSPFSIVELVNGRLAPAGAGRHVYYAQVRVDAVGVVETAILHLMLVDRGGYVFATNEIPLMLLKAAGGGNHRPQSISVDIPRDFYAGAAGVKTWVQVKTQPRELTMFERIAVESKSAGPTRQQLTIKASNPSDQALPGAVFFVRAIDLERRTLARWRVDWDQQVEAGRAFSFDAVIETDVEMSIAEWEVLGAALPAPQVP